MEKIGWSSNKGKRMSTHAHKKNVPGNLMVGLLTVSTTRTRADDKSGQWIRRRIEKEGHQVVYYQVIPDDRIVIRETVVTLIKEKAPHIVILTGGTGLSRKDVTIEAVTPLFRKTLSSFGPLFAQLSFEDIDSAAMGLAGVAGRFGGQAVPHGTGHFLRDERVPGPAFLK